MFLNNIFIPFKVYYVLQLYFADTARPNVSHGDLRNNMLQHNSTQHSSSEYIC